MAKIYNCTVKLANGNWVTYHSVNHLGKFVKFIDTKEWLYFNVYDKEDKSKSNNILASYQNGKNRNVPTTKDI
ncbi:hypothetical protein B0A67_24570 [Flavobacterium aquidurense]|uniref:hypothetical protein n=1 Tax=Flavobacterium aquidurense TaxID=362413 RepID=UPI000912B0AF|nr:hypothetical protein [Flavobacterium aquidurense]OXA65309.1 hypothetical protein B0A67_24570 [Flavobacterium aquidurense]SHH88803.1 hypothetical protein SAMN05444481_14012 [Flavobacterium frigidimaris]